MTNGHREKLKGIDERTVFTGWRKFAGAKFEKAGEVKKVKHRFNRRIRRNINQHLLEDIVE